MLRTLAGRKTGQHAAQFPQFADGIFKQPLTFARLKRRPSRGGHGQPGRQTGGKGRQPQDGAGTERRAGTAEDGEATGLEGAAAGQERGAGRDISPESTRRAPSMVMPFSCSRERMRRSTRISSSRYRRCPFGVRSGASWGNSPSQKRSTQVFSFRAAAASPMR